MQILDFRFQMDTSCNYNKLQLLGFDLTVVGEEVQLNQTVIRWKGNCQPTQERG